MKKTNKLPSKFQIGATVTYKDMPAIVESVRFTESKVLYWLRSGIALVMDVDSTDVN